MLKGWRYWRLRDGVTPRTVTSRRPDHDRLAANGEALRRHPLGSSRDRRQSLPWPRWTLDIVLADVPEDLRRMVRLGVMTCQRESDLIRMGVIHRETLRGRGTGIWCRPKKTRRRRKSVFIPLRTADALELDRWAETPITFSNTRWKAPRAVHNAEVYLYSPRGKPYTGTSLRARWHRWLGSKAGLAVCAKWREWLAEQVAKYEWEIDPDDVKGPTIHGLRGTGVLTRWTDGYDTDQISNDIGMSRQMVDHCGLRIKWESQLMAGSALSWSRGSRRDRNYGPIKGRDWADL